MKAGLPPVVMPQAASTGSAGEPGPGIGGTRGTGVPVAAEELGDLRFQGGLHQQLRAEPRHLLQDLRQRPVSSEQLIDVVADTVNRRYSDRYGRGSFPSMTCRS